MIAYSLSQNQHQANYVGLRKTVMYERCLKEDVKMTRQFHVRLHEGA
jgi:hypothetical protein